MGISIVIASIFIYMSPKGEKEYLLDLEINAVTTSVEPGQPVEFKINLFNIGHDQKFDVHLVHQIIDTNGTVVSSLEEEIGVITRASKLSEIRMPSEAKAGTYKLETTANYQQKTASASFEFSVFTTDITKNTETCLDGIKNHGEEDIDCGGPCTACKQENPCPECDDNNSCTFDYCNETTNFECKHDAIEPCCEDIGCEQEECIDCGKNESMNLQERMKEVNAVVEKDPQKAAKLCAEIEENAGKDYCFNEIALSSANNRLCMQISDIVRKDSCIMNVAINTNDYSDCELITNKNLKESCALLSK